MSFILIRYVRNLNNYFVTCEHAEEKEEDKEEDNCPKWYDDSTGLIPYQLSLILCFYNL